jgi:hypothetical protein
VAHYQTYDENEDAQAAEEAAAKLIEKKRALDDAWKTLARDVLSTCRVNPKIQGNPLEMFIPFDGKITEKHVRALQRSDYGQSFLTFLTLWDARPQTNDKVHFSDGVAFFQQLSQVTHSVFREIQHYQKDKPPLSDEEILRKAVFLTTYYRDSDHSNFDVIDVSEQLNIYLDSGIEWNHLEKCILQMSVRRAYDAEMANGKPLSEKLTEKWFGKSSMVGFVISLLLRAIGFLLPRLTTLAVNIWVLLWSVNNLTTGKHPVLALIGLYWVALSTCGTFMLFGTYEIRLNIRKLTRPPFAKWNELEPFIDADLHALNKAFNRRNLFQVNVPHINLRLVREQLTRLQNSTVEFPTQLLTLLDRSIAKGCHYW